MALPLIKVAAEIRRLNRNLTRRSKRIADAGIRTNAMQKLQELKELKPENARQQRQLLGRLQTLDKAQGIRSQTAGKVAKREAAARERDLVIERAKDPMQVLKMNAEERRRAAKLVSTQLRNKVKYVNDKLGGSIGADKAEQILEAAPDLEKASHNQLAHYLSKSANALDYKTLTAKGIEAQKDTFGSVFGRDMDDFTRDEVSAMWDALKAEQEKYGYKYNSWSVAEAVMETIDPSQKITFLHTYRNGDAPGSVVRTGTMAFFSQSDIARTAMDLEDRGIQLAERGTIPVPVPPKVQKSPLEQRMSSIQAKRFLQQSRDNRPRPI